jgi:hypothetical protein
VIKTRTFKNPFSIKKRHYSSNTENRIETRETVAVEPEIKSENTEQFSDEISNNPSDTNNLTDISDTVAVEPEEHSEEAEQSKQKTFSFTADDNHILCNNDVSNSPHITESKKTYEAEFKKEINDVIVYTQKTFDTFANENSLSEICNNIVLVIEKKDFNNLRKVTISTNITPLDLYHYGWNIWKHFSKIKRFIKINQLEIATFLKHTFPETLKKANEYSIKSHLKDDDRVGIIKIEEDISK